VIELKNEHAKRVDHPIPYLVDLVGRLIAERDQAIALCIFILNQIEAKEGGDQTEADIKKWVIDQIGEKPKQAKILEEGQ
jgi:hypothetical protein